MCSCQKSSPTAEARISEDAINFRVDDMACGHCAGTIENAIKTGLPGTTVSADPGSKIVSVRGPAEFAAIRSIVIGAGYTPGVEPIT
ncbi:heavy-metal-associated domain-containing protein [Bosea sp. NPDC055353]